MSKNVVYQLFQSLQNESILLSFKGVVTSDLLASVLQIMESKLSIIEDTPKTRKKVFNVLVECLQNLYHHINLHEELMKSKEEVFEAKSALFLISRKDNSFYIKTGNYIEPEEQEELEERLKKINSLDRDELRDYYREILIEGNMSDKGTAGLGMIDIARKSGNKLEYEFIEVNDHLRFFCLNVKID